jgi:tetratricopeptide (TPR) repeat protein
MTAHLILLAVLALAPATSYNQGNQLYARKDYAGAARAYEQALQAGPNPDACYNLGNALFKSGHVGRAIVQYRRAGYLRPRDADTGRNLAFARAYRVDRTPPASGPLARGLERAFRQLSAREAALLAVLLGTLAAFALALWIVRRRSGFLAAALALAMLASFCLVTRWVWAGEVAARPAVIVVPEVDVLSGPGEEFKQILLVHDGTEVRIREQRGGWLLVQLPGGNGGWLRTGQVERVY